MLYLLDLKQDTKFNDAKKTPLKIAKDVFQKTNSLFQFIFIYLKFQFQFEIPVFILKLDMITATTITTNVSSAAPPVFENENFRFFIFS